MRQMKDGQLAFFYHSNCKEPGIAGVIKVSHSLFLLIMVSTKAADRPDI